MQVDVKCSVSNCTYWKTGNDCTAPAIMVTVDQHGNSSFKEEIANEIAVDLSHMDTARNSAHTCCHTFKPK
jgi:hypothetical protein